LEIPKKELKGLNGDKREKVYQKYFEHWLFETALSTGWAPEDKDLE